MPIYEYECQNCGRRTEALQKLDDPPLTTCEVCEGELKKLISSPAFQFKGSGWYVTDYARKGGEGAGPGPKEGGDGGSKGEKGEGKAASGSEGGDKGSKESGPKSDPGGSKED